jgi:uncharacterized protein YbjQ (UPF0145 family)
MTLVNTDYISGKELETLGLVKGSTIRAKHLGNDIVAGLKMIVGGELTGYGDMINEARAISTKRMVDEATAMGADAVINVRYATSSVAKSAAEVLVYGTAIKYK